ncbi:hypothetical protein QX201_002973 [Fusarium graminearum]
MNVKGNRISVSTTKTVEISSATGWVLFLYKRAVTTNIYVLIPTVTAVLVGTERGVDRLRLGISGRGSAKQMSEVGVRQLNTTDLVKLASHKEACVSGSLLD